MFSWLKRVKNHPHLYYGIVIGFIFFVAAFTRLWKLGAIPTGLTWDEAALGYIGRMVVTTGVDEHFDRLPLVFQSFGDYKAPLAMYITGIFTTILGLHVWAVRLPFALTGIASVGVMMWITWRLTQHRWYTALSGWLLAITPWHLLFSRVAFESGMALLGVLLLLAGWLEVRRPQTTGIWKKMWWLVIVLSSVASIYVYHSTKVVVPLMIGILGIYEYFSQPKYWRSQWRWIGLAILGQVVLLLPFFLTVANGTGLVRASQTTIFSQYDWQESLPLLAQNLSHYFTLDFLVQGATDTLRHSTGTRGVLFWSELLLLVLGCTFAIARPIEQWVKPQKKFWHKTMQAMFPPKTHSQLLHTSVWIWGVLLILGLLPAAIGIDQPHPNRALLALPAFIILMVSGARELERELNPQIFTSLLSGILLLTILEWASFWNMYTTVYQARSSADWLDGYREAVQSTHTYIAQNKRIKFTSTYGEPEIFFAFYNQIPFDTYRQYRVPSSVEFGPVSSLDAPHYDVLISPGDKPLPDLYLVDTINRADNTPAFYIYETH